MLRFTTSRQAAASIEGADTVAYRLVVKQKKAWSPKGRPSSIHSCTTIVFASLGGRSRLSDSTIYGDAVNHRRLLSPEGREKTVPEQEQLLLKRYQLPLRMVGLQG